MTRELTQAPAVLVIMKVMKSNLNWQITKCKSTTLLLRYAKSRWFALLEFWFCTLYWQAAACMNEAGKPSFCTKVQFSLTSDPQVLALQQEKLHANSQCLKITEKVAFSIASEASYVYILSGQKFIKNAKNGQFGKFLKIWSL